MPPSVLAFVDIELKQFLKAKYPILKPNIRLSSVVKSTRKGEIGLPW